MLRFFMYVRVFVCVCLCETTRKRCGADGGVLHTCLARVIRMRGKRQTGEEKGGRGRRDGGKSETCRITLRTSLLSEQLLSESWRQHCGALSTPSPTQAPTVHAKQAPACPLSLATLFPPPPFLRFFLPSFLLSFFLLCVCVPLYILKQTHLLIFCHPLSLSEAESATNSISGHQTAALLRNSSDAQQHNARQVRQFYGKEHLKGRV